MEWELIVSLIALLSFILLWTRSLFYNKVSKRKDELLKIIENKMEKTLDDYKNKVLKNKKEFIFDIVGLYTFETRIKNIDKDLQDMFIGFMILTIYSFILVSLNFNLLIIIIGLFVFEFTLLWSSIGFVSLYKIVSNIEKFDQDVPPREFVKKMRIR